MRDVITSSHTPVLLAVFAHPDDESYRSGGTLALLTRCGVCVQLLIATRGEAGSRGDPPLCTAEELPAVRERELRCACSMLGIEPPRLLDYHDGRLKESNPEHLTEKILAVIRQVRPQVVLTFGPDGLSGHHDHVVIGQCAAEAYRRAEDLAALYAVAVPRSVTDRLDMQRVQPVPDEAITLSVDVSPVWEVKLAAIRCHATQLGSSPVMRAPVEQQHVFLGTEHFVRLAARRPDEEVIQSLVHQV